MSYLLVVSNMLESMRIPKKNYFFMFTIVIIKNVYIVAIIKSSIQELTNCKVSLIKVLKI